MRRLIARRIERNSFYGNQSQGPFFVLVLSETVLVLVLERVVINEPIFDHERLDVYRLSIDYVAFSYRMAGTLGGMNRPARDQWLRAAQSIPLNIAEGNGKSNLKRIVSMLTRLIQRTSSVSEGSIEYEYEYRAAEYAYEEMPEQGHAAEWR